MATSDTLELAGLNGLGVLGVYAKPHPYVLTLASITGKSIALPLAFPTAEAMREASQGAIVSKAKAVAIAGMFVGNMLGYALSDRVDKQRQFDDPNTVGPTNFMKAIAPTAAQYLGEQLLTPVIVRHLGTRPRLSILAQIAVVAIGSAMGVGINDLLNVGAK